MPADSVLDATHVYCYSHFQDEEGDQDTLCAEHSGSQPELGLGAVPS